MSAPVTERPSSSTSSSGHVDGLGRRSLAFDRATGAVLERLTVRPELAVFEQVLRRRVAHLATLEDERFARPSAVERDPETGELVVVAEFVTGSRLSELLETAADAAIVPGVDVALGYLLESLPALSVLHTLHRVTHGAIDPTRTVLTPEGQAVFLDVAFGTPIERLALPASRLWTQFGVATLPSSNGAVRFDAATDIGQVALSALMLILGRNIRTQEFPDALPSLLLEVIDVAQIRGSASFATGLQRFFQRALPLPSRRAYSTADDALTDVKHLVREIGVDVCRKAVVDFVENMDTAYASTSPPPIDETIVAQPPRRDTPKAPALKVVTPAPVAQQAPPAPQPEPDIEDDGEELELSLDNLDALTEPEPPKPAVEEIYELSPLDPNDYEFAGLTSPFESVDARVPEPVRSDAFTPSEPPRFEPEPIEPEPIQVAPPEPEPPVFAEEPAVEIASAPTPIEPIEPEPIVEPVVEAVGVEPPVVHAAPTPPEPIVASAPEPPVALPVEQPAVSATPTPIEPPAASAAPTAVETPAIGAAATPAEAPNDESPTIAAEPERESASSRRKKRQQQRSARARKDKLRSTTTGQTGQKPTPLPMPVPVPEPPPVRPASPTGWLVSPQRSAPFEAHAPDPAPPMRVPLPAVPSFTPSPVAHVPQPVYAPPQAASGPTPAYGIPMTGLHPPQPSPLARPPAPPPPPTQINVKGKTSSPTPQVRKPIVIEPPAPLPIERPAPVDRLGTMAPLTLGQRPEEDQPRAFPWKLAAVAVLVAVIAIVVGRSYLPQQTAAEAPEQQAQTPAPAPVPPPVTEPEPDTPIPSNRGRLVVQTQPAGIKVLVDRKPAGDTPLTLDLPPGRRTLTFVTSGGEVNRAVRIVAGRSQTVDIPVFSGWLSVVAPFVLDVAENGERIGTTEQTRLTLPPGRHQLAFSNKDLGYSSVQDIEIEPGTVKSITIDPRGSVSLNASPWAEIWLDGRKLGDTPLVTQVPLGIHEFLFKHPQHGERRVNATVRATGTSPLSVDFTK